MEISSLVENNMLMQNTVTAAQVAAKFQSKKEIYFFLTLDVKAYLPHHTLVTI